MRMLLLALGVLALVACGGGSDGVTSVPPNVTGAWSATVTVTGGTEVPVGSHVAATLYLTQGGNGIAGGTFLALGGNTGSVVGQVSGQTFTFTIYPDAPCGGQFNGVATINAASNGMTGTYSGSECGGTLQTTFSAALCTSCSANP